MDQKIESIEEDSYEDDQTVEDEKLEIKHDPDHKVIISVFL